MCAAADWSIGAPISNRSAIARIIAIRRSASSRVKRPLDDPLVIDGYPGCHLPPRFGGQLHIMELHRSTA